MIFFDDCLALFSSCDTNDECRRTVSVTTVHKMTSNRTSLESPDSNLLFTKIINDR